MKSLNIVMAMAMAVAMGLAAVGPSMVMAQSAGASGSSQPVTPRPAPDKRFTTNIQFGATPSQAQPDKPKTRAQVVDELRQMSPAERDQWRRMYHGG